MYEKLTEKAQKVFKYARQEAQRMGHQYIGTEHLLLGLVREGTGVAATVLQRLGVDPKRVRLEVEKIVKGGTDVISTGREFTLAPRAKKAFEYAFEEAKKLGQNYIGTEHILLGLLREEEGIAAQVLLNLGVELEEVQEAVLDLLGPEGNEEEGEDAEARGTPAGKSKTPALDSFGRDLTRQAANGELDPVIGREKEIERVIQVLCRRKKNNPVLLGEAGVGKTAIVEGLAQDIVSSNVPRLLRNRRIVIVDLALMVAGTKYRGQFEERIKAVMQEVTKAKNIVLFIDELHTLVGAGGAEGAIDASNVLKPALARGEMQCIGATTPDEYRKYIEKDGALERRFQPIMVDPPSREETIEILKGLRDRYEAHHCVHISDEAIVMATDLATRYITGRFLPDKALDVIDEACSLVRLRSMTTPPEVKLIQQELARLHLERDEAVVEQDFERAAGLRDQIHTLEQQRKSFEQDDAEATEAVGTVGEDVVRGIVSKMTGVPLARLEVEEASRLLQMEDEVHKLVVSQAEAVGAVSRAIRRSRSGMKDPRRPVASFLFIGPTGVGKTLLARGLAKFLFGDEEALFQIDMSEYMEKHNVSRLVGAPPGYVGYEEGGQLTERIRRRPYAVVLFDEIEKAHSDVFNMLLQIMEDGRLTDSFGRRVDFSNSVLIMTSNIGAEVIKNSAGLGFRRQSDEVDYQTMKRQLMEEVEKHFRPEFLNRIDDIIVFRALTRDDLTQIVKLELDKVRVRLNAQDMELVVKKRAVALLIDKGYNPEFGARPLRRAVEKYLEDPLSEQILAGKFTAGRILVDEVNGELVFEHDQPVEAEEKEPTPAKS
jgi:ATP-dependent Clp protease ATP-binding subunit ClpC